MMAHNLCYTTLTTKEIMDSKGYTLGEHYVQTPNNGSFVTRTEAEQEMSNTMLQISS